jgi:uncharacterized membrane protein YheB (UPF0754 family)
MQPALLLTPIIPAIICWLLIKFMISYLFKPANPMKFLSINFHGFLPQHKNAIAIAVAKQIRKELINENFLHQKLTHADTLQKAMPLIEAHIDNFLNHKLKQAIPVISMFVGEKITYELKQLFLKELEELFPSVMSQFISDLSHSEELEQEIVVKLTGIQIETIEQNFYRTFRKEINKIELMFALAGLLAGIIQLIIILIASK